MARPSRMKGALRACHGGNDSLVTPVAIAEGTAATHPEVRSQSSMQMSSVPEVALR